MPAVAEQQAVARAFTDIQQLLQRFYPQVQRGDAEKLLIDIDRLGEGHDLTLAGEVGVGAVNGQAAAGVGLRQVAEPVGALIQLRGKMETLEGRVRGQVDETAGRQVVDPGDLLVDIHDLADERVECQGGLDFPALIRRVLR